MYIGVVFNFLKKLQMWRIKKFQFFFEKSIVSSVNFISQFHWLIHQDGVIDREKSKRIPTINFIIQESERTSTIKSLLNILYFHAICLKVKFYTPNSVFFCCAVCFARCAVRSHLRAAHCAVRADFGFCICSSPLYMVLRTYGTHFLVICWFPNFSGGLCVVRMGAFWDS